MEVIYKKRFQRKVDRLLRYIQTEFGEKGVETFKKSLIQRLDRIRMFPESGTPTSITNVRSFIAGAHTKVYYKLTDESIIILNLYDMRQDPTKNIYQ